MGEGISRRSFLGLGALGAAGLAALGLAGCAPQANNAAQVGSADVAAEAPTAEELPAADTEESCDVVVVGLGTSGLVAASAAAKEGAKVIGLDRSASMGATNAAMVSGVWAVESSPELQYDNHLTTKDMFDFIWTSTHYPVSYTHLLLVLVGVSVAYSALLCLAPETGWYSDVYPWAYQGLLDAVVFWR